MYFSIVSSSKIIYSHIHYSFPIATLVFIVLSVFPALAFALMFGARVKSCEIVSMDRVD